MEKHHTDELSQVKEQHDLKTKHMARDMWNDAMSNCKDEFFRDGFNSGRLAAFKMYKRDVSSFRAECRKSVDNGKSA